MNIMNISSALKTQMTAKQLVMELYKEGFGPIDVQNFLCDDKALARAGYSDKHIDLIEAMHNCAVYYGKKENKL